MPEPDRREPVTLREVFQAAARVAPHVRQTPLEYAPALSAELGHEVWLKLECWQRTGSFKPRGALNRLLTLPDLAERPASTAPARGILTCSAGNHGLGVAEAARLAGVAATVVVPENVSPAKLAGLRRANVELLVTGADYDEAEARARAIAGERKLPFISPYNDPAVIAGAGTVALEVFQELPAVGTFLVPVGGGGLAAGVGVVAKSIDPAARVIGVQPAASPAMHAALAAGRLTPIDDRPTLADGLAGNIEVNSLTFPLVQRYLDDLVLVDEAAIATAMLTFLDRHHLVVEGAGAVGLAALQSGRATGLREPVVLLVSGRNVATETLARLLAARG